MRILKFCASDEKLLRLSRLLFVANISGMYFFWITKTFNFGIWVVII